MKQYIYPLILIAIISFGISCSEDKDNSLSEVQEVSGLGIELAGREVDGTINTRAISGFSVNTSVDPTTLVAKTSGWGLHVKLYDRQAGDVLYGESECTLVGSNWVPNTQMYFPNYLRQEVEAILRPTGWDNDPVVLDQSTSSALSLQDILVHRPSTGVTNGRGIVFPAHIPTITMEHKYSMLDFVLKDVISSDIQPGSVKVLVGTDTYIPYQVPGLMEYLVILPVGTMNPKVTLTTANGIRYEEEILIDKVHADGTHQNTCYCANLIGVELLLSTVTIADWTYGEALSGLYTTIASNPTFNGPAGTEVTLIYRSDVEQTIFFNRWGEATIKPAGRTILQLRKADGTIITLPTPIVLDNMTIDLNPYLNN